MHTIELELQDELYQRLRGIDIESEIKKFLSALAADGYPAITEEEARRRVSKAVEDYKNGTDHTVDSEDYAEMRSEWLKDLEIKYADR